MDEQDIRDGLCEMAEIDLDYPYQAFARALVNAGISDNQRELVKMAIYNEIVTFRANQVEWGNRVYNS